MSGALPTARDAEGRQLPRTYVARRRSPARVTRNTPAEASPVVPSQTPLAQSAPLPNDIPAASLTTVTTPPEESPAFVPHRPAATEPAPWIEDEPEERSSPFAERTVALPVTPLSDRQRRDEPPPNVSGDRPIMQWMTLYLLIAMITLVSVTVGVLVGRWMSRH